MPQIANRENLYHFYDKYVADRKEELNNRSLKAGSGLLKAYVIETRANAKVSDWKPAFGQVGWMLRQIEEELFEITESGLESRVFLDVLSPRYSLLLTTEPSQIANRIVLRGVRNAPSLDHAWLSSPFLNSIWQELIPSDSSRFATLHYEQEPLFDVQGTQVYEYPDEDYEGDNGGIERQTAKLEVRNSIRQLNRFFRASFPHSNSLPSNLTSIRVPAVGEKGRYDYFSYGKVTNRGQDFRGFRLNLESIVLGIYGRMTETIETRASFGLESHRIKDGEGSSRISGALVTFAFHSPLSVAVFDKFIDLTFERGQGPFRLWGNPLRVGVTHVHLYGMDLHLWQQVYLDMTPERFILVLPEGTCGNTVHRLLTNIQRYLDPYVTAYIGDTAYESLIQTSLRMA